MLPCLVESLGKYSGYHSPSQCSMQSEGSGMYLHNHQMHLVEPAADDDYMGGTCHDLGRLGSLPCECLLLAAQYGCLVE